MFTATTSNPALQICWALVGITTVIFAVRAACALLPRPWRMRQLARAHPNTITWPAAAVLTAGTLAGVLVAIRPAPATPLDNDASAGRVVFTFDDGPDAHTAQVIAELHALHVHGVFFVIGWKAHARPGLVRAEAANGEVVGNHTYDHRSLTGKGTGVGTGNPPLTQAQVRWELAATNAAIVAAGAPRPTLWRPPYGAVNAADVATARSLGLRVVLDSGDNIVDSNDWAGLSAAQIAARVEPRLRDQTIVAFHDGLPPAPAMIRALPLIVAYMNAHHLGATTTIRPDATGGIVSSRTPDNA